jgi:hypothetical protein
VVTEACQLQRGRRVAPTGTGIGDSPLGRTGLSRRSVQHPLQANLRSQKHSGQTRATPALSEGANIQHRANHRVPRGREEGEGGGNKAKAALKIAEEVYSEIPK